MISSIFGKTKPISFIIVLSFLFLFYWATSFLLFSKNILIGTISLELFYLVALLLSIFVVNFIVSRNKLTGANTYTILIFTLFILVFPRVMANGKAILSGLFILISIRRLISIKTLNNVKKKIFDATSWVLISSLFYDWALLYLVLVFITIYFYQPKKIRNWLVPIVAFFAISIIIYSVLLITGNIEFLENHYLFSFKIDDGIFQNWRNHTLVFLYILSVAFSIFFSFVKLGKTGLGRVISLRLILISLIVGLVVFVLKNLSEPVLIFTFFPAAVFVTNYIESIKRPNIKETVLICSVVISIGIAISGFFIK
ncbi:hypothetical protein GGR42_001977 [Saonia flava]|uniref:Uncharacterized protein n=1 Tax=Saonia flava TaxID=523696 RepID=A0A846R0R0_9FLAO|nr:DUF6427 family protein [Saonia flava]NJB71515.1 hypothetical protein [Saonia flava]